MHYTGLQCREDHHIYVLHWVTVQIYTMSVCYAGLQRREDHRAQGWVTVTYEDAVHRSAGHRPGSCWGGEAQESHRRWVLPLTERVSLHHSAILSTLQWPMGHMALMGTPSKSATGSVDRTGITNSVRQLIYGLVCTKEKGKKTFQLIYCLVLIKTTIVQSCFFRLWFI